uniref:Uncharacterized protein n=1 Tax=Anguilla anguilla TaxID=7936 RepID=A0A0E9RUF8_ANGAN
MKALQAPGDQVGFRQLWWH